MSRVTFTKDQAKNLNIIGPTIISTAAFKKVEHQNPKKSKYRNKRCEYAGLKFDSQKERDYYIFLKGEEKAKRISHLSCQKVYVIEMDGKKICKYIADFVFINLKTNKWEIVDVKSEITKKNSTYKLKKKLMAAKGWDIIEC